MLPTWESQRGVKINKRLIGLYGRLLEVNRIKVAETVANRIKEKSLRARPLGEDQLEQSSR